MYNITPQNSKINTPNSGGYGGGTNPTESTSNYGTLYHNYTTLSSVELEKARSFLKDKRYCDFLSLLERHGIGCSESFVVARSLGVTK